MNALARYAALLLAASPVARAQHAPRPFVVGERAEYAIKYLFFPEGKASLSVAGIDTVRRRDAYHFVFTMNAGALGFHARDTLQSWTDTASFITLRSQKDQHQTGTDRSIRYEMYPERATYSDRNKPEVPSVSQPLDDIGFLFFVRTLPLEVGSRLTFDRYFKPASNPVRLQVLRKEKLRIKAGTFNTIVVRPIIKTSSLFDDDKAEVWITDDSVRAIVQIKTKVGPGTLTFELKSYQRSFAPAMVPRKDGALRR